MLNALLATRRRRRASATVTACAPVRSLLVCCTANRVRSPYAAAYLTRQLPVGTTVHSRGILPGGQPVPDETVQLAAELGLDLRTHVSQRLAPTELIAAQLVVVMEGQMRQEFARQYPAVKAQLVLLGDLDPDGGGGDIDDPYLGPIERYRASYARIRRCCDALAALLRPVAIPSPPRA